MSTMSTSSIRNTSSNDAGAPRYREFLPDSRQPFRVDIAQCLDAKLVGVLLITLGDVVAADATSDDRNPEQLLEP